MSPTIKDTLYGRGEISLLAAKTVVSLFGPQRKNFSKVTHEEMEVAEFVAYILYRTALPDPTIYHSLHLLRRLSQEFDAEPSSITPFFYHKLVFSALVLATKYHMDDAYANSSWAIASQGLFSLKEINQMEFSMLSSLDWVLRLPGEDLETISQPWEMGKKIKKTAR